MEPEWREDEGLFKKLKTGDYIYLGNFCPKLKAVLRTQDGKEVILVLHFVSGQEQEVRLLIDKLKRVDWFELCSRCIVNEEEKDARVFIKQMVRIQIAQYEEKMAGVKQYTELGWNKDISGKWVYVSGNCVIGEKGNAYIDPSIQEYELQFDEKEQQRHLRKFTGLWQKAPPEALVINLYAFTGLIRQLYKEAGVPVDFVLYLLGEQQSRKTMLAKQVCNLYCRQTDMDFSVRTVGKTSAATAEKLISRFKDTTLILDDVAKTGNRKYKQMQEDTVERVTRMIGNRARKSGSIGRSIQELQPNANVVVTGEYLPNFSESTLSRMLIVEIKHPVNSKWLTAFGENPSMYSTVAYNFIAWVQKRHDSCVSIIQNSFQAYRKQRENQIPYQERIQEHGFILQSTYALLGRFMMESGCLYIRQEAVLYRDVPAVLHNMLKDQVKLMEKTALKDTEKDFCCAFAELYMSGRLEFADDCDDYEEGEDDGFKNGKGIICISPAKLCGIVQRYFRDSTITIQSITKQFKRNRFLATDASNRSTKKVKRMRYLHISKEAVKDYYKYVSH